jgi:lysophospholipase L1-like esterase
VESLLERAGIDYVDLASEFTAGAAMSQRRLADYYLYNDPMHLSPLGHALVAGRVERWWKTNARSQAK